MTAKWGLWHWSGLELLVFSTRTRGWMEISFCYLIWQPINYSHIDTPVLQEVVFPFSHPCSQIKKTTSNLLQPPVSQRYDGAEKGESTQREWG